MDVFGIDRIVSNTKCNDVKQVIFAQLLSVNYRLKGNLKINP